MLENLTGSDSNIDQYIQLITQYAINVIAAIVILFIGNLLVKFIVGRIASLMKKKEMDQAVIDFISTLLRYGLFMLVLLAALSQIGVQTASFVAVIAAAGLAVGLALQGSLSNFAAGVLIVFFRPFKTGDYVEISGTGGTVETIQIFQTILKSPDNKMVVVPNSGVISNPIVNYSRHKTRRVDHVIGVAYGSDLKQVKQVITETLAKDERILQDPQPTVAVSQLADSSVNLVVRPWVKTEDYWGVYFDSLQAIKEALDEAGIEIPFPQVMMHTPKQGEK